MSLVKKIRNVLKDAVKGNSSPSQLALSFAIGIFIAFSPYPGAHTIMMLAARWLFKLNFPVLFLATSFNNPWTMVPFFAFDYSFGYWFIHSILRWDPSWVISLERIFGSGRICLWSFFIGGNLLGVVFALLSYPVMIWVFSRLAARRQADPSVRAAPSGRAAAGIQGERPDEQDE